MSSGDEGAVDDLVRQQQDEELVDSSSAAGRNWHWRDHIKELTEEVEQSERDHYRGGRKVRSGLPKAIYQPEDQRKL